MLNRRGLFLGGAALGVGTGLGAAALLSQGAESGTAPRSGTAPSATGVFDDRHASARAGARAGAVVTHVGVYRRYSAARGQHVNLVTMLPSGTVPSALGICLVLHGRFNSAEDMVRLGLPQFLTAAVRSGVPPFAMVAVDGDDTYWVDGDDSDGDDGRDDPQAMLADELPGWLNALGLRADGGRPRTVLGISMGGFGALVYVRRNTSAPPRAIATLSAGLLRTFGEARYKHVYTERSAWERVAPLRHLAALPESTALGVWCGRQDLYYRVSEQLAEHTHPAVVSFTRGRHDAAYWRRALPSVLRFLGPHNVSHQRG